MLFGLVVHSVVPLLANDWTRDRSHRRSSIASAVQLPVLKISVFAATRRAGAQSTVQSTPRPAAYGWAFAR